MKLKEEKEWKIENTAPGEPVEEDDVRYGMKACPSNNAEEMLPKEGSVREPEIRSIRSCSITPLELWVFCNGTIVS